MTERTGRSRLAEVDARSIVPVADEIGGVVIYLGGAPAYYVLNGEWFEALPEPGPGARAETPPWPTLTGVLRAGAGPSLGGSTS